VNARSTTSPDFPSGPIDFPSTSTRTPPALPMRISAWLPRNVRWVPAGNVPSMVTLPSTATLSHDAAPNEIESVWGPERAGAELAEGEAEFGGEMDGTPEAVGDGVGEAAARGRLWSVTSL